jgi:hypothetical protein
MRTLVLVQLKLLLRDVFWAVTITAIILILTFFIFVAVGKADTPTISLVNPKFTAKQAEYIQSPTPKLFGKPNPVRKARFDSGWLARAHWTAAAFDWSTTGYANKECIGPTCRELDPVARVFMGTRPQPWRLALGWAGESAGVSFIPNRRIRRIVQIGLIASHVACGVNNLRNWH